MIVVDTNVLAYMIFESPYSAQVNSLHLADADWHAPVLWRSEFTNLVAGYYRKKIVNNSQALEAIDFAGRLIPPTSEHNISPMLLWETVSSTVCSSYDCEFVALAKILDSKLVTYDKMILQQFPKIAQKPEDYLASL